MMRTRIVVGSLLALAAAAVLVADRWLAPWFLCLFLCLMITGVVATRELVRLLPAAIRPREWLAVAGVCLILASNFASAALPSTDFGSRLIGVFVGAFLAAFLVEMYHFREPGGVIPRLALTVFVFVYLGVLGSFFTQLRWLGDPDRTSLLLALTIFVPKAGDIGAFFTGTFLGRHKMTPILSPKKTWEGFAGGMLAAMLTAIGLSYTGEAFRHGIMEAAAFGLVIGIAGVLGDLAESLIKRDGQTKDASLAIPGFGGLLDVVDSVLFAAPVAYFWFTLNA
jgi:phosphatidate cytidylyltransferase